jgi:very-short-patch-repair endonuclease
MARIDAAIAERAGQQLGLITTGQLDLLGCTRQMRRSRVASGLLRPAGRRVWRYASTPTTWEQHVLGAALEAGEGAVVSHMSAARLWRFADIRPGAIEISVPSTRNPGLTRGRLHRVSVLDRTDVRRQGPFVLTSPERTLADVASRLPRLHLELILDGAARDGLLTVDSALATATRLRCPGRRGLATLTHLLGDPAARTRTESWLERRCLQLIRGARLPTPRTQVSGATEHRSARVDLLYDEARLIIEVDGHATHSTRRQRQHDAEREAALLASGWRVIRFTYEDVTERPAYVTATIRQHLGLPCL